MRSKSFIIGGVILITFSQMSWAQKSKGGELKRVDAELSKLERNIRKEKDLKKAFDVLFFGKKAVLDLIEGFEYTGSDQATIETINSALMALPSETIFSKQECPAYKNEMLATFAPKSTTGAPEDPRVLKVWNILERLCR